MHDIYIDYCESAEDCPCDILIEGLPGVGLVGKLAAEHMIEELGAEKIAVINSIYFPPQVILEDCGVARLPNNEIYRYEDKKKGLRVMFLVGDFQSATPEGHYALTDAYLNIAKEYGVKRIYTLGGYGVGHLTDKVRVIAAVNDEKLKTEVEKAGAEFTESEPGGGIIGAAGLLLGMGKRLDMEGICIMGETSGYLVDPRSATSVLAVLSKLTGLRVDTKKLQKRAVEMEAFVDKVKGAAKTTSDEELNYIG
ncbi:MAG: proteasome assembly chaperone family protein [Methanomicrobium sp.]|nr:proteasome assembly chaperone family protein [Methanomicrobium sp.]